jgi:hypothetical protein
MVERRMIFIGLVQVDGFPSKESGRPSSNPFTSADIDVQ